MSESPESSSHPIFPYERSPELLRERLVPDPVDGNTFATALSRWRAAGAKGSLLRELLDEGGRAALADALGVRYLPGSVSSSPDGDDAAAAQLRRAGYLPLQHKGVDAPRLVTGGPVLPPRLADILGTDIAAWEWVLAFPEITVPAGPSLLKAAFRPEMSENERAREIRKLLHALLRQGATDIHIELEEEEGCVRAHFDGRMRTLARWGASETETSLRILKQWCRFSQAGNSLPQDGRISLAEDSRPYHLRAGHLRTRGGESLVLRVHRPNAVGKKLPELGFPEPEAEQLVSRARHESGLFLFVGPTGSGKTTSACALLAAIASSARKLLSIEDPVEQELPFAVQSDVDERHGWTFDAAIRAFLRQDPDLIFVGEIRDAACAQAAFRASVTGHTVVATLHAADSRAALARLREWALGPGLIREGIRGIVSQRLLRSPDGLRLDTVTCRFGSGIFDGT